MVPSSILFPEKSADPCCSKTGSEIKISEYISFTYTPGSFLLLLYFCNISQAELFSVLTLEGWELSFL